MLPLRRLRFQLIENHGRTGQILQLVPDHLLPIVLAEHGMNLTHAVTCIDLHRHLDGYSWEHYQHIEAWWHGRGESSPSTASEALSMFREWRGALN